MFKTLAEISKHIGAELSGDANYSISGCAGLEEANAQELSFVANPKYLQLLDQTCAGAIVIGPEDAKRVAKRNILICKNPYFAFRQALVLLHGFRDQPAAKISTLADINPAAEIGSDCCIEAFVYIAAGVKIGDRCVIYPHCYLGPDTVLGDDCILYPNVTIYDQCELGNRVTLHAGCVIGEDGFGYAHHEGEHHKIPQTGNVAIEDDVEMGAGCAVDRATVGTTRIGHSTKFSDHVVVGHGARVGPYNLLVAQVGLGGSVQTGRHVTMAGQVGVAPHLKIGERSRFAAKSGVIMDTPAGVEMGGQPALPFTEAKRNFVEFKRLPKLRKQVKKIKKQLQALQDQIDEQQAVTSIPDPASIVESISNASS